LKPELIEQPELMQVKLILHIEDKVEKSFVSHDETKNVTKDVTKDVTKEITERQRVIIEKIIQNGTITTSALTQKIGISQRTLIRELSLLQAKEILSREGGCRDGRWIIK